MTTTAGGYTVTSYTGRFVERGLEAGQTLHVAGTAHTVSSVPNDYTVVVTTPTGAGTNVHWQYSRGRGVRDLHCLLQQGPNFDQGPGPMPTYPTGYREALRFIAHDPFWYGVEQTETWEIPVDLGDLVFDGLGAWCGGVRGIGRWLFALTSVSESIDIVYWGTAPAKPIVTLTGPMINPAIFNQTIGDLIQMNYIIAAGEIVTINTSALTAQNNFGVNLLPFTTGDLATFGLSPCPQAADRVNQVQVSFVGGQPLVSQAELSWKNRHVGLA